MLPHGRGGLVIGTGLNRIEYGEVLSAPIPNAPAVDIAAEFQKAPEPVLLLDNLNEKGIAAELREHLMERGIGFEKLLGVHGGDVRMPDQIHDTCAAIGNAQAPRHRA